MTSEKSTMNHDYFEQGIDFREPFRALWRGKLLILSISVFFTSVAVYYALNTQQWWSARAVITTPKVSDIVTFSQTVKRYQPAFDIYQPNGQVFTGSQLDVLIGREVIYERFVESFNATNYKREFLDNSDIYMSTLEELGINTSDNSIVRLVINEWIGRIKAGASDKKNPNSITLSIESTTAESSYKLLTDYITFINEKVTAALMDDLNSTLKIKMNELSQQLESRRSLVAQQLDIEIEKTKGALRIAKSAQINKPIENLNSDELFTINIGSDALIEKINVLSTLENLSIIDPYIGQIRNKLDVLERELPVVNNLNLFSYLEEAEIPITRDKPNRVLIVMLGSLFGVMVGMLLVLIRFSLKSQNIKQ